MMIVSFRRTIVLFAVFVVSLMVLQSIVNIQRAIILTQHYADQLRSMQPNDYYDAMAVDANLEQNTDNLHFQSEANSPGYRGESGLSVNDQQNVIGTHNIQEFYKPGIDGFNIGIGDIDIQQDPGIKPDSLGTWIQAGPFDAKINSVPVDTGMNARPFDFDTGPKPLPLDSELQPGPYDTGINAEPPRYAVINPGAMGGSSKKNAVDQKFIEWLGCKKLPDILTIGFEKCGTMTLNEYLGIHPKIFRPTDGNYQLFNKDGVIGVRTYTKNRRCTPSGQMRLNKMSTRGVASKAYEFIPNAKLLAIVREPVERAMSHYIHRKEMGMEVQGYTFDSMIASIMETNRPFSIKESVLFRQSSFIDRLEPWIDYFGIENIHIVDGDNFVKNPVEELQRIEQFLGIEPYITLKQFVYNPESNFFCLNHAGFVECMPNRKGRAHPQMTNETRTKLKEYFRPLNERLFETIGRRFNWND